MADTYFADILSIISVTEKSKGELWNIHGSCWLPNWCNILYNACAKFISISGFRFPSKVVPSNLLLRTCNLT